MEKMNKLLFALALVLSIGLILSTDRCNRANESNSRLSSAYTSLQDSLSREITSLGDTIVVQRQLRLSAKEAQRMGLLKKDKQIAKLQSRVFIKGEFRVDSIFVPFSAVADTVFAHGDVRIPFKLTNRWYNIEGIVLRQGLKIRNISFKYETEIRIGFRRLPGLRGYFKPKEAVVIVFNNNNPHMHISSVDNLIIIEEKKWHEKTLWKLILSGAIGFTIGR